VSHANSSFAGDHKIASVKCLIIFACDGFHTILSMTVFEVLYGYKDLLFVGNCGNPTITMWAIISS
jgi:hypothetical protein